MDVPGATVEVVATTTNSNQPASVTEKKSTKRKITTPTYREELLLKWAIICKISKFIYYSPNDEIILALRASW